MTSPLASIALTYGSVDLQESDLQIFFEITRGIGETPTVRGVDTIVPARPGRIDGNRINDTLGIELHGWVCADPAAVTTAGARASFAANRATVRTLFAPDRAPADLVATLEDGTILTISARPLPTMLWDEQIKSEMAYVNVELEGLDDWVAS